MTPLQRFVAGYGRSVHNLYQGVQQLAAAYVTPRSIPLMRQQVAESRAMDAPLLATTAGNWGNIVGTGANLLPTAFIPGANTIPGSFAIGAMTGALQPSTSTQETALNTGVGAVMAPASLLAGRAIGSVAQGVKGLVSPFFNSGQAGIAARTLVDAAGGPEEAALAAQRLSGAVGSAGLPGYQPTTAELANNGGLAQLERTLRNNPDLTTAFTNRLQENRAAIVGAVRGVGGTDADIAAAEAARSAASAPLYSSARSAVAPVDAELKTLINRPSMQAAIGRAKQLAAEQGDTLIAGKDIPEHTVASAVLDSSGSPFTRVVPAEQATISGKGVQYLKMALNDMVNTGHQQGIGAHEINAVRSTLSSLNEWTAQNVPGLRAADEAFKSASVPINQLEVGRALTQKLIPALAEFGGEAPARLNANSFASALRNGDSLASKVTGWRGSTLENTLAPDQLAMLRSAASALSSRAAADDLGRAVGSPTAQNLISQNMLRQLLGPLGLPQGWAERGASSTIGQTLTRPFQWAGQVGEGRVMGRLAQAALSPQDAAMLLRLGTAQQVPGMLARNQGLLAVPALTYAAQQ